MTTIDKKDIKGITLLDVKEVENLPRWLLANGEPWWLRSPGYDRSNAVIVCSNGLNVLSGSYVGFVNVCVRPAIEINVRPYPPLMIGETVLILDRLAQFVSHGTLLLCDFIGCHRFDKKSNDYGESEIKKFLENWLKEKLEEEEK